MTILAATGRRYKMKNKIQNSFCEIIENALKGLRRLGYISREASDKITAILDDEVRWDE